MTPKVLVALVINLFFLQNIFCQPTNDNCINATALSIQTDVLDCGSFSEYGVLTAATASADANACGGVANDDVWFSFVATSDNILLSVYVLTSDDLYATLYTGSCGSLSLVHCLSNPGLDALFGLTVGQQYFIRIYSDLNINTSAEFLVCAIESPPPPPNDDCTGAINLISSSDGNCSIITDAITSTYPNLNPACVGPFSGGYDPSDDVWFSFTATSESHHIEIDNRLVYGTMLADLAIEVYTGTCGALSLVSCSNKFLSSLTVGQIYYIRVYRVNSYMVPYDTFGICVTNPPDCNPSQSPPSDDCASATQINSFNAFCGTTLSSYTPDQVSNFCISSGASVENNSWLTFVASSTTVEVKYWVSAGGAACPTGIQYALFSGSCGSLTEVSGTCINPTGAEGSFGFISWSGLTVGQTYYIMIDGYLGEVCDYVWQGFSGILLSSTDIVKFTSEVRNNNLVELNWNAVTSNIMFFEVEKRTENNQWTTLDRVDAYYQKSSYKFYDYTPNVGHNYYRLKAVDNSQNASYSNTVSAQIKGKDFSYKLNTTTKELNIITDESEFSVSIYSYTGSLLIQESNNKNISLSIYPSGIYLITISASSSYPLRGKIFLGE
jgi:hypothetical protein